MSGYPDEQLQAVFNKFDADGSGAISMAEVKNALIELGESEEKATEKAGNFMVDGDDNNDKKITFQEFKAAMQ